MDKKKLYKKPEIKNYGKIKDITMGTGSIESENNKFKFG